uniref:RNA 3'-terminal phosphate cyclase domain-containing protein n=1 Tax=Amazona collaria TaxID=241587 RepID=A0A8B9G4S6_9PSIT
MAGETQCLSYAGCNFLRQRLVLATLSGRPIKIRKIRAKEEDPGLRDFEASFIRLIDKVTNGSRIEINQTGEICSLSLFWSSGLLSVAIGYEKEILYCKGGEALEWVAQGSCECSIAGGVQGQVGHSLGWCGFVEGVPAHGRDVATR